MENLFTKDKINTKRQIDLDIAKGLAIIFMVIVHVNEVYQSTELHGSTYNRVIEFLGSPPCAPIFMFLLGVGMIYSRRTTASYLLKRGLAILCLGYALNFVRDFIPYSILASIHSDPEYTTEAVRSLFGIDILQFSGLAFIFFGLIKKFNVKTKSLPIFYFVFASLNLVLRGITFENPILNSAVSLIWGTDDYCWFPFLSWIGFVIGGYIFGGFLIRCKDTDSLYKKCFTYCAPALVTFFIYAYINEVQFGLFGEELFQGTYYQHELMGDVLLFLFAMCWISILHFAAKSIPSSVSRHFSRWSRNINLIYCVHWTLLGFSMLIFEELAYEPTFILPFSLVLFILSDIISNFISTLMKKKKK